MSRRTHISAVEARRIAFAAQGFDRHRPLSPNDIRHYRRAMTAINVLQLDFVNVLMPAHFLMIWSRLGAYDRERFERFLYDSGEYTEQWAHEASIVSSSDWPLLEDRRRRFSTWKNSPLNKMPDLDEYLSGVLNHVDRHGCTTAHDLPVVEGPKRKPGDWHRSIARWGLEHHFGTGNIAVRRRLRNFQRVYDRPQRVIDSSHLSRTVAESDAHRELSKKACASLGVATCKDIADYYRMTTRDVAPRLEELVDEGVVARVDVEGWSVPAFLFTAARSPRSIPGASLLSPFDPMVWYRPRARRLFGFEYRIEIYVPKAKRRWGYYVLPFRVGDQIVARVDLKADRKHGTLSVQQAHLEDGTNAGPTAESLALELRDLAAWLKLECIRTAKTNAFEKALARALVVVPA